MRKIGYIIFVILLGLELMALPPETGERYHSGGRVIGFTAAGIPIPPTRDFMKTRKDVLNGLPAKSAEYTFICDDTILPGYRAYLTELLTTAFPVISRFYGDPPVPDLTITLHYDGSSSDWFFYDTRDHTITISDYPDVNRDDDGDGLINEDPLDGVDNDGDGRIDEDSANDPAYDAVLVHELTHSWHDDLWMFASWAEEGMTECATELAAEYMFRNRIRDIRYRQTAPAADRVPRYNLLYFDMLDQMGPDLMGGTTNSFHKVMPSLFYRSTAALFYVLCASQADAPSTDLSTMDFLRRLNAVLHTTPEGIVEEAVFMAALDEVATRPVDGILPVSRWVGSRAVANTVSRPGARLGIYTLYGLGNSGDYFTVINPAYFNIFAIQRTVDGSDTWNTTEQLVVSDSTPVWVRIYNTRGDLVWVSPNNDEHRTTLASSTGNNWQQIGHTENWQPGWYRITAEVDLPGFGRLSAQNHFLVRGPEFGDANPFDSAEQGVAIMALGAGGGMPLGTPVSTTGSDSLWQADAALLIRPQDSGADPFAVNLDVGDNHHTVTVPQPYTRVVPLRDFSYIFPDVWASSDAYTGMALVNAGGATEQVQLSWYDEWGGLFPAGSGGNPIRRSLVSGQQMLNTVAGAFGTSPSASGWVRLNASADIKAFSLNGDFAANYLDGTLSLTDATRDVLVPAIMVEDGYDTELSVINPAAGATRFWLQLYDSTGAFVEATSSYELAGHAQLRVSLHEAFGNGIRNVHYVILSADAPVVAVSMFVRGDCLATLPGVADTMMISLYQEIVPGPLELYSPQLAIGGGFHTDVQLVNVSPFEAVDVTAEAHLADGELLQRQFRLEDGEKRILDAAQLFGRASLDGWIRLVCSHPLVRGAVFFGDVDAGYLSAQPLARQAMRHLAFGHVAHGDAGGVPYFTGLALLNPSDVEARVTVRVHDSSGAVVRTRNDLVLAPGERLSQMISDYFDPPDLVMVGGWIEVESTVGLFGYELFGDAQLNFLSAVPPMPIR